MIASPVTCIDADHLVQIPFFINRFTRNNLLNFSGMHLQFRSTSPIALGALVLIISLIAGGMMLLTVMSAPFTSTLLEPVPDGAVIVTRHTDAVQGARVVALRSEVGNMDIQPGDFASNRAERAGHEISLSDHLRINAEIHRHFSTGNVQLQLEDGQKVDITTDDVRPLLNLTWEFWLRFTSGIFAWLLGATLWVWQPGLRVNQLTMLTGFGLMVTWLPTSVIYGDLEMFFLPLWLSQMLTTLQCLGIALFATTFTCLNLYFPSRLGVAAPVSLALGGGVALYTLYLLISGDFVLHPRDFFMLAPVLIIIVLASGLLQWRFNTQQPIQRAQQLWFIFAATVGPAVWFLFYWLPVKYQSTPLMPVSVAPLSVLLSYALAVLGIWTHPSFKFVAHIETIYRWWITSILFFAVDVLLISITAVTAEEALIATIALILWIYIPARQWVYNRVSTAKRENRRQATNQAVLKLVESSYGDVPAESAWTSALRDLFDPVELRVTEDTRKTGIQDNGRCLSVRPTAYSPGYLLDSAERGRRLFNESDVSIVQLISEVFENLYRHRDAFQAGRVEERQRISRDLHDQIGSKLLSMLYSAENPRTRELARETVDQLGELLRALKTEPVPLMTLEAELKRICTETCDNCDLALDWHCLLNDSGIYVMSTHYLSIMNIVRELLNNTVRHSGATRVGISIEQTRVGLRLEYQDNGSGFDRSRITPGNGLRNIEDRAAELDAMLKWDCSQGCSVVMHLPLQAELSVHERPPVAGVVAG